MGFLLLKKCENKESDWYTLSANPNFTIRDVLNYPMKKMVFWYKDQHKRISITEILKHEDWNLLSLNIKDEKFLNSKKIIF